MSGLLYKHFRINYASFLFTVISAAITGAVLIVFCIFIGPDGLSRGEDMQTVVVMSFTVMYYLAFLLPSLTSTLLFQSDEKKVCAAFAMSVPPGGKGFIESKYWYILIQNLAVLFILFLADTVSYGILRGQFRAGSVLMLFFCWRLLISAIEVPFVVRFGSQKGIAIKGLVIAFVAMLLMIYLMFGDISWLINSDDPITAFKEWLESGKILFPISLFPFISCGAYFLSCKISIKVFRKGAENYEQ